jgi:uncharacterized membrane-anchored protein
MKDDILVKIPRSKNMSKLLNRVPEVVATFWIIKVLSTTVGETFADYLSGTLNFGLNNTSIVMSGLLAMALIAQFRLKRYVPAMYWLVVVLMSITGTLITDCLVGNFNIGIVTINWVFAAILFNIFAFWYANEKNLAMHSINTTKRELFYWAAILFTFALGTATGDFLAETLKLGYAPAALLFAGSIAVVAFLHYALKVNGVLTFWLAYILTRPLGASIGDLLSQSTDNGGLGLGTTGTSMLFLSIITSLIIYLSLKHNKSVSLADRAE